MSFRYSLILFVVLLWLIVLAILLMTMGSGGIQSMGSMCSSKSCDRLEERTADSETNSKRIKTNDNENDPIRIVCISDTHNGHRNKEFTKKINEIKPNILVHAGDFGDRGTWEEREDFWNWLESFKDIDHKIFVSGNMDGLGLDNKRLKENQRFPKNDGTIIYLENESTTVKDLKFYGSPYTPEFYGGFQYKRESEKAKDLWNQIPDDCDILISHGPPAGILDKSSRGSSVGCETLKRQIDERPSIKAVIFGHVHYSYGSETIDKKFFVNAAQYNRIHDNDKNNKILELIFDRQTKKFIKFRSH